jgi:hypothetical protein
MVFFFESTATTPPTVLYMGKDKFENEELIKWAANGDFWFHVDDLSSAHVYIRPPTPDTWTLDTLPEALVADCAALTKANSIEGCKLGSVRIVYTPAANLRKEKSFAVGQVAFFNERLLRYVSAEKKNDVVNRLNRTKTERVVDFEAEMAARLREEKHRRKAAAQKAAAEADAERARLAKEADLRCYGSVFRKSKDDDLPRDTDARRRTLEDDFF